MKDSEDFSEKERVGSLIMLNERRGELVNDPFSIFIARF